MIRDIKEFGDEFLDYADRTGFVPDHTKTGKHSYSRKPKRITKILAAVRPRKVL